MKLQIAKLGNIDYAEALNIQEKLMELRINDKVPDTLLILEHYPVLTLGRRGKTSNILVPKEVLESQGISVYEVSRGGDVTYHGPGQIVGYPIVSLANFDKDSKRFISGIEEIFIKLLDAEFGIKAHCEEKKYTGVWVGNDKITAIGMYIKHWVTMHGFAFNINTDLEHFHLINPCGITDKGVTSLEKLLDRKMDMDEMSSLVIKYFCQMFNYEPEYITKQELLNIISSSGA